MKFTKHLRSIVCLTFVVPLSWAAHAQSSIQLHFKQVHIAQSYAGSDGEALIVRGQLHSGKKISLRIKGVASLPYGPNLKSECVKLGALAAAHDQAALEIVYVGSTPISVGVNDAWQYKEATLVLPADAGFSCVLANVSKYDYAQTTIQWYDLP